MIDTEEMYQQQANELIGLLAEMCESYITKKMIKGEDKNECTITT